MKKKLCLCYCPAVIDKEGFSDQLSPETVPLSTKVLIGKKPEKKALFSLPKPSFLKQNKNLHKLPSYSRRKIFTYKFFPRLLKAILFQDPVVSFSPLKFYYLLFL